MEAQNPPIASVIVPVWNGRAYLEGCLTALFAQEGVSLEGIVVDNGSTDGSADFVAAHFPTARLFRNDTNLGFAGGCNVGLRAARGEILVLLNQDTQVQPRWLRALVAAFERDPAIGIAGSKALYPDGTVQHAGGWVDEQGGGHHFGHRQPDDGRFDEPRAVDFVTGASLAIRRAAFQRVGELDEGFAPAYHEDVDWCYRVRGAGLQVCYVPDSRLIHDERGGQAPPGADQMFLTHRNRLRFVLKHWPLARLVEQFLPLERAWLTQLEEGGEWLVAALHRAYLHHLLHLAEVMAWRQRLLGANHEEADEIARGLITLRATVPLRPARLPYAGLPAAAPAAWLAPLQQRSELTEFHFHSDIQGVGSLVAGVRSGWYQVAARWPIEQLRHQQNQVNQLVLQALGHLQATAEQLQAQMAQEAYDRQRLGEVLAAYLAEQGREIAELTYRLSPREE